VDAELIFEQPGATTGEDSVALEVSEGDCLGDVEEFLSGDEGLVQRDARRAGIEDRVVTLVRRTGLSHGDDSENERGRARPIDLLYAGCGIVAIGREGRNRDRSLSAWIPSFTGMTHGVVLSIGTMFARAWIPAFAGMTENHAR